MLHSNVYVIHSPTMMTGQYHVPKLLYLLSRLPLLESLSYDVCLFNLVWSTPWAKCRLRGVHLVWCPRTILCSILVTRVSTNVWTTSGNDFKGWSKSFQSGGGGFCIHEVCYVNWWSLPTKTHAIGMRWTEGMVALCGQLVLHGELGWGLNGTKWSQIIDLPFILDNLYL